jgi:hypothetical protein
VRLLDGQFTDEGGRPRVVGGITRTGGPAPVRAHIDELLPDVLDGTAEPGHVFDRTASVDEAPEGAVLAGNQPAIFAGNQQLRLLGDFASVQPR